MNARDVSTYGIIGTGQLWVLDLGKSELNAERIPIIGLILLADSFDAI